MSKEPKKKRGRPPKQKAAEEAPKKKRGRPPKVKDAVVEATVDATEESTEPTPSNIVVHLDSAKLPQLKIGDRAGLGWSMKQLDEELSRVALSVSRNDYHMAVVIAHQIQNGNFQELGFKSSAEYYEETYGLAPKTPERYLRILMFLRVVLGIEDDAELQRAYEGAILRRVDALINFVTIGAMTPEEAMEEMMHASKQSGMTQAQWELHIKENFGKRINDAKKQKKKETGGLVSISAKVEEVDYDTIIQAHKVAQQLEEDPKLSLGAAFSRMAAHFVSHYGEGIVDLAASIKNLEKAHGMMLIPIGVPGKPNAPKVAPLKIYEAEGVRIFMDSKRAAAKALGVPTSEVKEVLVDPRPYLKTLGYSDDMEEPTTKAPKELNEMSDEDVLAKLNELRDELKISRKDWAKRSVGRSARQQVADLIELKEKKLAGEPIHIKGKSKKDDFDPPAAEIEEVEEVEEVEEEAEEDAIYEEDGMYYLDEKLTIPCDEYGRRIDDDGNVIEE
jgi:ribosomal protein L29